MSAEQAPSNSPRAWSASGCPRARPYGRTRVPELRALGHCNFIHLVDTASHDRAVEASRQPFVRVMGTHRAYEHLQECYLIGSIDRINARIADLVGAGLQYLVLGPVSDDPKQVDLLAKRVVANFV